MGMIWFGWLCRGFVDPFCNVGACSRSIDYGCESGVEVPPEPAVRKLQQQHKHNIFYKYIKRKKKIKKRKKPKVLTNKVPQEINMDPIVMPCTRSWMVGV